MSDRLFDVETLPNKLRWPLYDNEGRHMGCPVARHEGGDR